MSYVVLHAPGEVAGEGPWATTCRPRTLADAEDELASWHGPRLRHGDVVFVEDWQGPKIARVFDAGRSELVTVGVDLALLWTRPDSSAILMLHASLRCDLRRVVLAACDCAREALRFAPPEEPGPRMAVEAAEKMTRGEATPDEVRYASSLAVMVRNQPGGYYAAGAAVHACQSALSHDHGDNVRTTSMAGGAAREAAESFRHLGDAELGKAERLMASIVRRHISLSDVMLSAAGLACWFATEKDPQGPRVAP